MGRGRNRFSAKTGLNYSRQYVHRQTPMKLLADNLSIAGTKPSGKHKFSCGNEVPVFEVTSIHALNQIIGYAKFINRAYGDVYYRGECRLHDTLRPSLLRKSDSASASSYQLNTLIRKYITDQKFSKLLKMDDKDGYSNETIIEGMLQHYGVPTRCIDLVDNHWIALWMGLNKCQSLKQMNSYYHYNQRIIPYPEIAMGTALNTDDLYQYILLIAIPGGNKRKNNGVYESKDYVKVDLRQALPSIFLRPHAQHGLLVRRIPKDGNLSSAYDVAVSVMGILKIRIDLSASWLGNGQLISQDNLFPAPGYDNGYDLLLSRNDLIEESGFEIARFV